MSSRPQSARSARESSSSPATPRARPQSARSRDAAAPDDGDAGRKPGWIMPSGVPRLFADPPYPSLRFLQPPELPERLRTKKDEYKLIKDICQYQIADAVKNKVGLVDTNIPGQPPRPRSGTIVKCDLANMIAKPRQMSQELREAVYLVRCDSTDTTLARGKTLWLHETAIERRPFGVSRDFCALHEPKWINKFGGIPKLFETIAADHERAKLKAEMDAARGPPTPRPRSGDPAAAKRKPPRPSAEAEVPKTRFRRECPPSIRVRYAPQPPAQQRTSS